MSTIDALVWNDIIVYDVDAHACIIDGAFTQWKRYTTQTMILKVWKKNCNVLQNGYWNRWWYFEGVFLVCADNRVNLNSCFKRKVQFPFASWWCTWFWNLRKKELEQVRSKIVNGIDVYFSTFASRWLILVLLAAG
jgi:hypothetical protein